MSKSFQFIQVPTKLLKLNLSPYDIAVFIALKKYESRNGDRIFPAWMKIAHDLGISRDTVSRSLNNLKSCNIIQWDRGKKGISNNYYILGTGNWTKKGAPKIKMPKATQNKTSQKDLIKPDFLRLINSVKSERPAPKI